MCKRVERICQVDPDGWYAPVIGEELIRCKDCKYCFPFEKTVVHFSKDKKEEYIEKCKGCDRLREFEIIIDVDSDGNGFCSWAERREK